MHMSERELVLAREGVREEEKERMSDTLAQKLNS